MTRKTIRFTPARRLAVGALVLLGACVWLSADAQAITIGIGSTADNTVVTLTGGGSGDRAQGRSLTVTNAGGFAADAVSANVTAATRFAATVAADRAAATSGSTATAQDAVDYTLNFTVTPDFLTST